MTKTKVSDIAQAATDNTVKSAPLYASRPQAGFPAPGDDQVERILDINDLVVQNPASTFFVRVEGDSMEEVGIFSGDVLVVDRAVEATVGRIVVAAVNGELLVKRLAHVDGRQALVSENQAYEPVFLGEDEECFVWGVVTGSVRQF